MTHADIINLWPSPGDLAADTGANILLVYKWRERNSIPFRWVYPLVTAAGIRGIRLTYDQVYRAKRGSDD